MCVCVRFFFQAAVCVWVCVLLVTWRLPLLLCLLRTSTDSALIFGGDARTVAVGSCTWYIYKVYIYPHLMRLVCAHVCVCVCLRLRCVCFWVEVCDFCTLQLQQQCRGVDGLSFWYAPLLNEARVVIAGTSYYHTMNARNYLLRTNCLRVGYRRLVCGGRERARIYYCCTR